MVDTKRSILKSRKWFRHLVKGSTVKIVLLIGFVVVVCINCGGRHTIRGEFEESLIKYNDLVRWNEFNEASIFVIESLSEDYMARVKAAKDVRVAEYRILKKKYDEIKGEAEAQVEIDYYTLFSLKVKTLIDTQKWVFVEEKENDKTGWRLVSPFPEFK